MQDRSARRPALFLRVYGTVSLVLFTTLLLGFAARWGSIDEGALAHALIMVPMALVDPMLHSKFLTDIPLILLLSGALALWRPSRAID